MGLFQLNSMTLGRFVQGLSPLHRLDPRTKILTLLIFMVALLSVENMGLTAGYLMAMFLVYRLAGFNLKVIQQTVRPLWVLIGFTFVIHVVLDQSAPRWVFPGTGMGLSLAGCSQGLLFSLRLLCLVLMAGLLTLTTAPMSIAEALYRLIRPAERLGLPAQDLAMMISIALRFIPILMEEAQRIYKAQLARGVTFQGNALRRARMILPILIPLFLSTFRRANELAVAMEARCYQSGQTRTSLYSLKFNKLDWAVMAGSIPALLPVVFWR